MKTTFINTMLLTLLIGASPLNPLRSQYNTIYELFQQDKAGCPWAVGKISPEFIQAAANSVQLASIAAPPPPPPPPAPKKDQFANPSVGQPGSPEHTQWLLSLFSDYLAAAPFVPTTQLNLDNGNALFYMDGRWGLKKKDGNVILPPDFDHVADASKRGFIAYKNGMCGYFDAITGKPILAVKYYHIEPVPDTEVFIVRAAGGYGIVNKGKVVLEPLYRNIYSQNSGSNASRKYYVINNQIVLLDDFTNAFTSRWVHNLAYLPGGKVSISENIYDVNQKRSLVCDGAFQVMVLDETRQLASIKKQTETYRFLIDFNGKLLSQTPFVDIRPFDKEGLAVAIVTDEGKNKHGLIDTKGQWVVPPTFLNLSSTGVTWIAEDFARNTFPIAPAQKRVSIEALGVTGFEKIAAIDKNHVLANYKVDGQQQSKIIATATNSVVRDNLDFTAVTLFHPMKISCGTPPGPLYLGVSPSGQQVLDSHFQPLTPKMAKFTVFSNTGNEALVGRFIIGTQGPNNFLFDCAGAPYEINVNGQNFSTFLEIATIDKHRFRFQLPDSTSYFSDGKNIFPTKTSFSRINTFNTTDLYIIEQGYIMPWYGVIDQTGKVIIPAELQYLSRVDPLTGNFYFSTSGKQSGLMDSKGALVGGQLYDAVYSMPFHLYKVKKGKQSGVVNSEGRFIIPLGLYNSLELSNGLIMLDQSGKYSNYDITGKLVTDAK